MFGLFKKKDPICGMTEEKGKGITKYSRWFCSKNCLEEYEKGLKAGHGCCH
ncbi:hypothetical protein HY486_04005 [Candidatus Woesearchaeota archaeon]|nr:hypothetical protein [Candidatus Woesearchaeota archaeon]